MNFKQVLRSSIFAFCILVFISFLAQAGIVNTKHNLSASGPGTIKAVRETEICKFCHTPHNAEPAYPLWNHELSAVENYINYWSPTLKSYPQGGAPPIDGFSKLCLSCHDGTIALGALVNRGEEVEMVTIPGAVEFGKLRPGAAGYLGTDLSGGHPISIIYDAALVAARNTDPLLMPLNLPSSPLNDPDVKLYPTQGSMGVQCPSCHDPHGSKAPPSGPPLWRKATYDEVCLVCHNISIPGVGH